MYDQVDLQRKLVDVCVELGTVKRFVPSDWASAGVKGVRWLFDKVGRAHWLVLVPVLWWMNGC